MFAAGPGGGVRWRAPNRQVGALGLVAALIVAVVVLPASPAGAETGLVVDAGIDGYYTPGEPIPVSVTVSADRLLDARLVVASRFSGGTVQSERVIEVPGGSVKQFVVVMPTLMWESPAVSVALEVSGETVASDRATVRQVPHQELVGVLPDLAAGIDLPETAPLSIDAGVARFAVVSAPLLDAGADALAPLDVLVAGDADMSGLGDAHLASVLQWVADGGVLLLAGPTSGPVSGLPDDAQPGVDGHVRYGRGSLHLVGSAVREGAWSSILHPTPTEGSFEESDVWVDQFFEPGFNTVTVALAQDAGFRLPDVESFLLLLGSYVLLAGPVSYLVLKRLDRRVLTWVTVPVFAVVFTGIVYVVGGELRESHDTAHATLWEVTPAGSRVTSYVMVTSRNGGATTLSTPAGWHGDAATDAFGFEPVAPSPVELRGESSVVPLALEPGEFRIVKLSGIVDGPAPLVVSAESSESGVVTGTVTNNLPVDLREVGLFFEDAGENVGTVPANGSVTFRLEDLTDQYGSDVDRRVWDEMRDPWEFMEFDEWGNPVGAASEGSPINAGLWTDQVAVAGHNLRPFGEVVAVGWTDEQEAPVAQSGRPIDVGRSAFMARAPVQPAGDHLTDVVADRQLVRTGSVQVDFDMFEPNPDLLDSGGGLYRFLLPGEVDGRPVDTDRLVMEFPRNLRGAAIFLPDGFVDVWAGLDRRVLLLPPEAVVDGAVYARVHPANRLRTADLSVDEWIIRELEEGEVFEGDTIEELERFETFFRDNEAPTLEEFVGRGPGPTTTVPAPPPRPPPDDVATLEDFVGAPSTSLGPTSTIEGGP